MKHEMNIVYIIAVIAWVIYSFVSKGNKQKNQDRPVDEKTPRPVGEPDIKRILEELLGKTETEKTIPPPVYEPGKPVITPVYETSEEGNSQEGKALNPVDNYEFGKYQTLEEVITDEATVASQYEQFSSLNYSEQTAPHSIAEKEGRIEVVNTDEEEDHPAKGFDIEKAIIYSEILKRPAWAA